jgi:DNA polymerase-3 subunit delta
MGQPSGRAPAYLLTGADAALLAHATGEVLDRLCGNQRDLLLTEVTPEADLGELLGSSPLFTEYLVVLLRPKTLDERTVRVLTGFLAAGSDDTVVVVSVEKAPAGLTKAVKAAGGEVISTVPKKPADSVRGLLSGAAVKLDATATALVVAHAGEDVAQVPALLATLATAYGTGARLNADQVAPYLGDAGGVPPWDLTDAIDRGDAAAALRALHRLLRSRVPIVVHALLNNHIDRLFRIAASGLRDEKRLAELLQVKGSTYPIRKALQQLPRWGDTAAAAQLVTQAGNDLRGASAWNPVATLEVLVGRLALRPRR